MRTVTVYEASKKLEDLGCWYDPVYYYEQDEPLCDILEELDDRIDSHAVSIKYYDKNGNLIDGTLYTMLLDRLSPEYNDLLSDFASMVNRLCHIVLYDDNYGDEEVENMMYRVIPYL